MQQLLTKTCNRPLRRHREPLHQNFLACAAPQPEFLSLSRITGEFVKLVSQPNIFQPAEYIFGAIACYHCAV